MYVLLWGCLYICSILWFFSIVLVYIEGMLVWDIGAVVMVFVSIYPIYKCTKLIKLPKPTRSDWWYHFHNDVSLSFTVESAAPMPSIICNYVPFIFTYWLHLCMPVEFLTQFNMTSKHHKLILSVLFLYFSS